MTFLLQGLTNVKSHNTIVTMRVFTLHMHLQNCLFIQLMTMFKNGKSCGQTLQKPPNSKIYLLAFQFCLPMLLQDQCF